MTMAARIHFTFPSGQAGLRARWRTLGTALACPVLTAQWTFTATFGQLHYMPEMKWSEEASGDGQAPGFKAQGVPQRLVDRLNSLDYLKSNRRQTFESVYKCTTIDRHMRVDGEIVAFLDKYMETLSKHADMWLRPPLVLAALADVGRRREVAVTVTEALNDRVPAHPSALTNRITPAAMKDSSLPSAVMNDVRTLAATGQLPDDSPLQEWLAHWVSSCPHQNVAVEGLFNIMDGVAAVGGPRLGPVEKERRVKGLCNIVLSQRAHEHSPKTGKPKQHHTTRLNVRRAIDGAIKVASAYTLDVAERANGVSKRQLENPLLTQSKAAARSKPERRKKYNQAEEARLLVVPRAGTFCT